MEHEARAGDGIDNWLIGRLRQQPRRTRGEDVVERMLRPRALPDVVARLAALESAVSELDLRLEALEHVRTRSFAPPSEPDRANGHDPRLEPSTRAESQPGHTFFVPTPQGYELVEAEGATPGPGASVTIDGRRYTVEGSRRTPLPADARPCLVLAHAPSVADEREDA